MKALVLLLLPLHGGGAQDTPPKLSNERLILRTTLGDIAIALFPEAAPRHAEQVLRLARLGAFDTCHFVRVERGFVAQLSDHRDRRIPLSETQKAAIRPLPAEFGPVRHRRGIVSMARRDGEPDSGETSFFLILGEAPHLDGKYTVFGRVVAGEDVLALLDTVRVDERMRPVTRVELERAEVVDAARLDGARLRGPIPPPATAMIPRLSKERIILRTSVGDLVVALFPDAAPRHSEQILRLSRHGVYTGSRFHRIHRGFVAQLAGHHDRPDPSGRGPLPLTPEQTAAIRRIPAEVGAIPHRRGVLSMSHPDGDPGGAQSSFSIMLGEAPHLDGKYSVFGQIVAGWEVLAYLEDQKVNAIMEPVRSVHVIDAPVVDEADLPRMVLRGVIRRAGEPDLASLPGHWALLGAILLAVGIQTVILSSRQLPPVTRSVGLMVTLIGFFILFVVAVPRALGPQAGWIGVAVLVLSVGLFRLMATFERPGGSPKK